MGASRTQRSAGRRPRPAGVALALVGAALAACTDAAAPPRPPQRLILIVVDTLRRDHLSCYGAPRATPNIDRIAEGGMVFHRALASYHQTSMSMGSLFSGRTPSIEFGTLERPLFWNGETWCGLARFASEGGDSACVPAGVPTLAQRLREAGYWTVGIASNQFLYEPSGYSRGFDTWVEVGEHPSKKGAIARIELTHAPLTRRGGQVDAAVFEALAQPRSERFFLYVHFMDAHDYGFEGVPYADGVAAADRAVGALMDGLRERGWLEDAVVVFMSDHGERLQERHAIAGHAGHVGNPSFQEVLEIPLIVAPPPDRDPNAPIRTEDVHRLLLEIADAQAGPEPELRDGELLLSETRYRTYLAADPAEPGAVWKSVVSREDGTHQLFDLARDPEELRDVAAAHPDRVRAHAGRIDELSRRFSARRAVLERISPLDRARLKALGYDAEP